MKFSDDDDDDDDDGDGDDDYDDNDGRGWALKRARLLSPVSPRFPCLFARWLLASSWTHNLNRVKCTGK